MKIVDTKGLNCPEPLIMTKKALKEVAEGESLVVITDNETSLGNLKRFLTDNHTPFTLESEGKVHTLTVTRGSNDFSASQPENYCEVTIKSNPAAGKDYIVVFSSERMGEGNDDLGMMLTRSFITTLIESDRLPDSIVFYNSGVRLAMESSFVIEGLKTLQEKGVKLLLCGTCVNFYDIKKDIRIGIISNMYEIAGAMMNAGRIIKP
ncbi:MAG: sulfurtransferase-like selenium metabolism protein YedF [Bacteroidales bacterium]